MKNSVKRALGISLRSLGTFAAWAAAFAVLWHFEYWQQWTQIDNVVGAVPVALALLFAGGCTFLLWMQFRRSAAPAAIAAAAVILLSAALFPNALRGNWWIDYGLGASGGDSPDLTVYAPFAEGSKAARLDGEASLHMSGELPLLDGATALYPVYAAFAQAVYAEEDFVPDVTVRCTNTAGAYRALLAGERDVIFCAAPSAAQRAAAAEAGVELCLTPIGKEAFVFVVAKSNPVDGLTTQQIYNIYSGKTAKWSTLGREEGGSILAFRRSENSGSEAGLHNVVMKGRPVLAPQPMPDRSLIGSNSLMQQVTAEWQGVQPGLGYSYRFFATVMYANPDTKLLALDGYAPNDENIRSGKYPFVAEVYAVTCGQPQGKAAQLIDWILSPEGQELVEKSGYAPIAPAGG